MRAEWERPLGGPAHLPWGSAGQTDSVAQWDLAVCWVDAHPMIHSLFPALGLHGAGCAVWRQGTPLTLPSVTVRFQYRSINHRMDAGSMWLYRWYYSYMSQW